MNDLVPEFVDHQFAVEPSKEFEPVLIEARAKRLEGFVEGHSGSTEQLLQFYLRDLFCNPLLEKFHISEKFRDGNIEPREDFFDFLFDYRRARPWIDKWLRNRKFSVERP